MNKPSIFISHITEEKEISIALKELIETKFLKTVEVFVSSHEDSIRLGDDWLSNIKTSLKDCKLSIIICSPISIVRPWVNFEAGAGWIKDIPVIPFCHSGLTPSKLPFPLNSFQGGELNNQHDLIKLFKRIADILKIACPTIGNSDFLNAVSTFEIKIKNGLLVNDTTFIKNLLFRQIELIKFSIYSSALPLEKVNELYHQQNNIGDFNFTFTQVDNIFNISLLLVTTRKKVFQVYYESLHQLVENIKFLLTAKNITIAPTVRELLNIILITIVKVDDWFSEINFMESHDDKTFKELSIKMIKDEELPPVRRETNNLINCYIDYYESLLFYKSWLADYEDEVNNIING